MWKHFRSAVSIWVGWFGVVAGALAIISVLTRQFDIGLRPILADFIEFYRELIQPIRDLLQMLFPFEVSSTIVEVSVAYAALLGLSVRAEYSRARLHARAILAPTWLRFLFLKGRFEPRSVTNEVQRAAKAILLVPVVFLQPFLDMWLYRRNTETERRTEEHLKLYDDPELIDLVQQATSLWHRGWKTDIAMNIAMFVAFPVAILLFFVINHYGVL